MEIIVLQTFNGDCDISVGASAVLPMYATPVDSTVFNLDIQNIQHSVVVVKYCRVRHRYLYIYVVGITSRPQVLQSLTENTRHNYVRSGAGQGDPAV